MRDIFRSFCLPIRRTRRPVGLDPEEQAVLDQVIVRLIEPDENSAGMI